MLGSNSATPSKNTSAMTMAVFIRKLANASSSLVVSRGIVKFPDGSKFNLARAIKRPAFVVVQEGGSSGETYVHAHTSRRAAEKDRRDCENAGSYRTGPVVEVPGAMAAFQEAFYLAAEAIASSTCELGFPSDD